MLAMPIIQAFLKKLSAVYVKIFYLMSVNFHRTLPYSSRKLHCCGLMANFMRFIEELPSVKSFTLCVVIHNDDEKSRLLKMVADRALADLCIRATADIKKQLKVKKSRTRQAKMKKVTHQ